MSLFLAKRHSYRVSLPSQFMQAHAKRDKTPLPALKNLHPKRKHEP